MRQMEEFVDHSNHFNIVCRLMSFQLIIYRSKLIIEIEDFVLSVRNTSIQVFFFLFLFSSYSFLLVQMTSCDGENPTTTDFCHWSHCKESLSETDLIDLEFIFGFSLTKTESPNAIVTLKNIELTIHIE